MSSVDRKRWELIAVVAATAIVNLIATKTHNRYLGGLGALLLFLAIALYLRWRRAARAELRARVFDREAKTDETGSGPDR